MATLPHHWYHPQPSAVMSWSYQSISQSCSYLRVMTVDFQLPFCSHKLIFLLSSPAFWWLPNYFSLLCLTPAVEAIHLGSLIAAQGYIFPISDHVLTMKDDGTFYRFQVGLPAPLPEELFLLIIIWSQIRTTLKKQKTWGYLREQPYLSPALGKPSGGR